MIAAPLRLAAVEGAAMPHRDEDVLQRRAAGMMGVDVTGGDRRDVEGLGELAERGIAAGVAALVWALQLDEEAVVTESPCQARGCVRVADGQAVPGAAREADEPLVQLLQ